MSDENRHEDKERMLKRYKCVNTRCPVDIFKDFSGKGTCNICKGKGELFAYPEARCRYCGQSVGYYQYHGLRMPQCPLDEFELCEVTENPNELPRILKGHIYRCINLDCPVDIFVNTICGTCKICDEIGETYLPILTGLTELL
jgi:hypothetical protein